MEFCRTCRQISQNTLAARRMVTRKFHANLPWRTVTARKLPAPDAETSDRTVHVAEVVGEPVLSAVAGTWLDHHSPAGHRQWPDAPRRRRMPCRQSMWQPTYLLRLWRPAQGDI